MTLYLGKRRVELRHIGRAHTAGDIVAWVPDANVVFSGDIVEYKSACYCGDAHFTDWPAHARRASIASRPTRWCRAAAMRWSASTRWRRASRSRATSCATRYEPVKRGVARGAPLKECFDEATRGHAAQVRQPGRSSSTASPSTSRAPTTRPRASTRRASGRPSATAPCGRRCRVGLSGRDRGGIHAQSDPDRADARRPRREHARGRASRWCGRDGEVVASVGDMARRRSSRARPSSRCRRCRCSRPARRIASASARRRSPSPAARTRARRPMSRWSRSMLARAGLSAGGARLRRARADGRRRPRAS